MVLLRLLAFIVVISVALCLKEDVVLTSRCAHNNIYINIAQDGRVSLTKLSQNITISDAGYKDFMKHQMLRLTLFAKDTQMYLCFNRKWKLVGMKNLTDSCYFTEHIDLGYYLFQSFADPSRRIGFTPGGKAVGPKKNINRKECFMFNKMKALEFNRLTDVSPTSQTNRSEKLRVDSDHGSGSGAGSGSGRRRGHTNLSNTNNHSLSNTNRSQEPHHHARHHHNDPERVARRREHERLHHRTTTQKGLASSPAGNMLATTPAGGSSTRKGKRKKATSLGTEASVLSTRRYSSSTGTPDVLPNHLENSMTEYQYSTSSSKHRNSNHKSKSSSSRRKHNKVKYRKSSLLTTMTTLEVAPTAAEPLLSTELSSSSSTLDEVWTSSSSSTAETETENETETEWGADPTDPSSTFEASRFWSDATVETGGSSSSSSSSSSSDWTSPTLSTEIDLSTTDTSSSTYVQTDSSSTTFDSSSLSSSTYEDYSPSSPSSPISPISPIILSSPLPAYSRHPKKYYKKSTIVSKLMPTTTTTNATASTTTSATSTASRNTSWPSLSSSSPLQQMPEAVASLEKLKLSRLRLRKKLQIGQK